MSEIKKFDSAFIRYVLYASLIVFVAAYYPVNKYASSLQTSSIIYGYLISLVNVLIGYGLNGIAFEKKVKSFMVIVFGGMIARMLLVAGLLLILLYLAQLDAMSLTASVFFFYFLFIAIEIKFLYKKSSESKKNTNTTGF
jgi:hypothetical protein